MTPEILVTGSRKWNDRATIYYTLDNLATEHGRFTLVHGACPNGADKMAEDWAKLREHPYRGFPAQWRAFGKKAGPIRNIEMLNCTDPILVVAFPLPGGSGTQHMIGLAETREIPVLSRKPSVV